MLLALLFHSLILALLLNTTFSRPAQPPPSAPITSFLYQQAKPTPAVESAGQADKAEHNKTIEKQALQKHSKR
ncbi:hypothetical protein [Arsukibacterium sp. MJ3]|uniref:hypothetical protein n=1 Tax=Arsukibacterium sp. MJ3 TaxID=1632859 RepID=UPI00128E231D|nr:hypothetical protein [Arsukibacterium sp. MJ3]